MKISNDKKDFFQTLITVPDPVTGNNGELEMRRRLPSSYQWNEATLSNMLRPTIPRGLAHFIHMQPFFFIATASKDGHCDANFRGRDYSSDGTPLPACMVLDEKTIVFPDFKGNGLYNSLGNILTNPHIGMLFIDFQKQRRARVNGIAEVITTAPKLQSVWERAQAFIYVHVEQAYGNCSARIPRMTIIKDSDNVF